MSIDDLLQETECAFSTAEEHLRKMNDTFELFNSKLEEIFAPLEESRNSVILQSAENIKLSFKHLTTMVQGSPFYAFLTNLQESHTEFTTESFSIKLLVNQIETSSVASIISLQKKVNGIDRKSEKSIQEFQKYLLSFIQNYSRASNPIETVAANAIKLCGKKNACIFSQIKAAYAYFQNKFKIEPNCPPFTENDLTPLIIKLKNRVKKDTDVNYIIRKYVFEQMSPVILPSPHYQPYEKLQKVNYFELDNDSEIKFPAKVKCQVVVHEGSGPLECDTSETITVIESGYSKDWLVRKPSGEQFYISSDLLSI